MPESFKRQIRFNANKSACHKHAANLKWIADRSKVNIKIFNLHCFYLHQNLFIFNNTSQSGINLPPLENNRSSTDYAFKKHNSHMNPMKNEISIVRNEKRARIGDTVSFNPNLNGLKNESPSKLAQRLTNDFTQSNYDKK